MAKIDITKTFLDLDGNIIGQVIEVPVAKENDLTSFVLGEDDKPKIVRIDKGKEHALTLRRCICLSLMNQEMEDGKPKVITEDETWQKCLITKKVQDAKTEVDLSPKDVTLILKLIHKFQPSLVYGQAREILDKS